MRPGLVIYGLAGESLWKPAVRTQTSMGAEAPKYRLGMRVGTVNGLALQVISNNNYKIFKELFSLMRMAYLLLLLNQKN